MSRKAKWLAGGLATLVALALAFVAAGPWLAINGLRNVVGAGAYDELWRFVDFDSLRDSLRPQVQSRIADTLVDRIGEGETAETIGGVTAMIAEPAIDAMVSPSGVAALLRGRAFARRLTGDGAGRDQLADPLEGASTRYVSASLFTASVPNKDGKPVVFEFRRQGLSWKLAGIRLPEN